MNRDDERREYFRIRDRLPVEFRQISREEFLTLQDKIRYSSTQVVDRIHELYFLDARDPRGENEQLHNYMQMINRKLDMIIEILGKSGSVEQYNTVNTDVSISGAGIQFLCGAPLTEGDFIELKIIIPVFPYPKITCLCQVLRVEQVSEGGGQEKMAAFKFMVINEKDQDILINYIFLKEREHLRQKKETES